MNYKEMLNKVMADSGLTNKEILKRCEELGEKITPNYLSVLKNQENKIPSDQLSIVLAKACNAEFENILIAQAYIDKAPPVIINALEKIKSLTIQGMLIGQETIMNDKIDDNVKTQMKDYINNMSLAELICSLEADVGDIDLETSRITINNPSMENKTKKWVLVETTNENDIRVLDSVALKKILDC